MSIFSDDFEPTRESRSFYPQRAAVIVDGGYWEALRKRLGGPKIDLLSLCNDLCSPAYRFRTYYFDGKDTERQSIHDQLELEERFEVVLGDVVKREIHCPACQETFLIREQKRVDVLLAVTLVHLASTKQVDMIVLLAGDRDFLPVVMVAKSAGVVIRLAYTGTSVAPGLFKAVDERIPLTPEYLEEFLPVDDQIWRKKPPEEVKVAVETAISEEEALIDHKMMNQIVDCLAELVEAKETERVQASHLGQALRDKQILYEGKLKDLMYLAKDKVEIHQEGTELFFSLLNGKKPSFDQDPAIKFLLETLAEILKKTRTSTVKMPYLGLKVTQKKPNWKKEFGLPSKKALTKLIQRANEWVFVDGQAQEMKVGLKSRKKR